MFAIINKILDWFKSLFWKEGQFGANKWLKYFSYHSNHFSIYVLEMELTLVGLQYSGEFDKLSKDMRNWIIFLFDIPGKTTFVNVIAVSIVTWTSSLLLLADKKELKLLFKHMITWGLENICSCCKFWFTSVPLKSLLPFTYFYRCSLFFVYQRKKWVIVRMTTVKVVNNIRYHRNFRSFPLVHDRFNYRFFRLITSLVVHF